MGYKEAPWVFKGRALYQLQLVKAAEARKYIPPEFKLVELFGYTLGGFYLARYDDSPVAAFDELVAMAGLVWNPPTSCAWAARVYVNNREARNHGLKHIGLPSRTCSFTVSSSSAGTSSTSTSSTSRSEAFRQPSWWNPPDLASSSQAAKLRPCKAWVELHNKERGARGLPGRPVCSLQLPSVRTWGFLGPRLQLSLPSFSGGTVDVPRLLKYSCALHTNVMPVPCAQVLPAAMERQRHTGKQEQQQSGELLDTVLGGKPLLALAFSNMVMTVEEPTTLTLPAAPQSSSVPLPIAAAGLQR